MTLQTKKIYDALIVGLGPVGATLAALLGKAGLQVMVVEPSHDVYPLPRAAHVDHEVMRIFQSLGLSTSIEQYMRPAPNYQFLGMSGVPFLHIEREGLIGASGWCQSYNIYQPGIENKIRELIAGMPNVQVQFGARFESILENNADQVSASVSYDGQVQTVTSRFLVGCDGAWSPVRESLGIALDDYAFDEPWLVLDAVVPDESRFPSSNLQLCNPERPTTFIHMGPGRLRWEFMLKPGEEASAMQAPETLEALLKPWSDLGSIQVERSAVYRFHGLVAKQWRAGRAFIAGDAAHQMPPFLGQGMCSGLRDAANLAWKIERAVVTNWSDALMDSYQQERDPHVRFIIDKAIEMGRLVCTLDPLVAKRRDEQMLANPQVGRPVQFPAHRHGWLLEGSAGAGELFPQSVSRTDTALFLDDVLDRRAWLVMRDGALSPTREDACVQVVRIPSQLPSALVAPISDWLDANQAKAVLVRPDRYVFGTGEPQHLIDTFTQ